MLKEPLRQEDQEYSSLFDYFVSWRRDGLALAKGASTRGFESFPFLEGEAAFSAKGWFHGEPAGMGRFGNVLEVIEGFSLFDAESL